MQLSNRQFHPLKYPVPAMLVLLTLCAAAADGDEGQSVPVAHDMIGCGKCHGAVASAAAESERLSSRCVACHDRRQASADAAHPFHQRQEVTCVTCHSFHTPGVVRAGGREFSIQFGDANTRDHCRSCHAPDIDLTRLDGGHRFAAEAVYHNETFDLATLSPSDGCLLCHDRDRETVPLPANVAPTPRFHTGASHPFGVRVDSGRASGTARIRPDIDPRIPLPGGMIECQTCHLVTGATKKLLLPFDDPYALCLGCHEVRQQRPGDSETLALSGVGDLR